MGPTGRRVVGRIGSILRVMPLRAMPVLVASTVAASGCVSVTSVGPEGTGEQAAAASPSAIAGPTAVPAAVAASPIPRPTPEPTPEPVDVEVFGFLPYWALEDAPAAMDTDLLTTVAWFGVEASGDGSLVRGKPSGTVPPGWEGFESDAFRDLQARLQADGVQVVLVVQRFGWIEGTAERTEELVTSVRARRRLAGQIANVVADRGLDGVNLDFEPMPAALSADFVALVREVRAALDGVRPGLHLSVDVVSSLEGYDLAALTADDAADVAIIMGYDYRVAGSPTAGSIAPLEDPGTSDLMTSVEAALAQVAPDRLVLALPWFGRAWSTEADEARSPTLGGQDVEEPATAPYAVAAGQAELYGRRYREGQESAWAAYPSRACAGCQSVWRQVWYDDPDSFGVKVAHALGQDLAGVGIWALGFEAGRAEMWSALRYRLRPVDDVRAPNGTASLDPTAATESRDGLRVVVGSAPLRLFAADEAGGSGLGYVRIGLSDELAADGRLQAGTTYPAAERITFPLGDPATGGSADPGPRSVLVQWRDLAGNWSTPLEVRAWAIDPAPAPTP